MSGARSLAGWSLLAVALGAAFLLDPLAPRASRLLLPGSVESLTVERSGTSVDYLRRSDGWDVSDWPGRAAGADPYLPVEASPASTGVPGFHDLVADKDRRRAARAALGAQVESLLALLADGSRIRSLSPAEVDPRAMGLADGALSLTVRFAPGGARQDLLVGAATPGGSGRYVSSPGTGRAGVADGALGELVVRLLERRYDDREAEPSLAR